MTSDQIFDEAYNRNNITQYDIQVTGTEFSIKPNEMTAEHQRTLQMFAAYNQSGGDPNLHNIHETSEGIAGIVHGKDADDAPNDYLERKLLQTIVVANSVSGARAPQERIEKPTESVRDLVATPSAISANKVEPTHTKKLQKQKSISAPVTR